MTAPIFCVGRGYPEGPPVTKMGCRVRRAGWYMFVLLTELEADWEQFNGFPILCRFSGHVPPTGHVDRVNWNREATPGFQGGVNISTRDEGLNQVLLRVDLTYLRGDGSTARRWYQKFFEGGFPSWTDHTLDFAGEIGGWSKGGSETALVGCGSYSMLPEDICHGGYEVPQRFWPS